MKELSLFRGICFCLFLLSLGCVSDEEKRAAIQQIRDEQLAQMELERKRVEERLRIVDGIKQGIDFEARAYHIQNSIIVTVIFNNTTAHEFLDFDMVCAEFANDGTKLGEHKKTLYETIAAYSEKIFEKVDMGKAHPQMGAIDCSLTDFSVKLSRGESI